MEVIHERCAGLDVHKETVVACLRVRERGQVRREVRRWATTTAELLELGDWLRQAGCTHVAMEATGVYWKPVWHVLEGEFELILANPAYIHPLSVTPRSVPSFEEFGRCWYDPRRAAGLPQRIHSQSGNLQGTRGKRWLFRRTR